MIAKNANSTKNDDENGGKEISKEERANIWAQIGIEGCGGVRSYTSKSRSHFGIKVKTNSQIELTLELTQKILKLKKKY